MYAKLFFPIAVLKTIDSPVPFVLACSCPIPCDNIIQGLYYLFWSSKDLKVVTFWRKLAEVLCFEIGKQDNFQAANAKTCEHDDDF